jgi:hypothetical protein
MSTRAYIVESGNWAFRIMSSDGDDEYAYIEAGTRAMEGVFGARPLSDECEFLSLRFADGDDYFDPSNLTEDPPHPMFSVVTAIRKETDTKTARLFLTSELFENASQPVNVLLAHKAELLEPDKLKKFRQLRKKQLNTKKTKKKS